MIKINSSITISDTEINFSFVRASGPGGQNVNKVATAVVLRFNVLQSSSLPHDVRARLLTFVGRKLTREGDLIIKSDRYRTQARNKQDALERLKDLLKRAAIPPKKRKRTKPTSASIEKRLKEKKLRGKGKLLRNKKLNYNDY